VSSTFDPVNTGIKMGKQSSESDPDLHSLEMYSFSLESRNRALRKILLKLQQNSNNNSIYFDSGKESKAETDSDILPL